MAITDDMIRAAIKAGQFNDPEAEEFLVKALGQRRDAIGRKYLPAINPVVDPALDSSGVLTFSNAAVTAGVAAPAGGYQGLWYRFDNSSGDSHKIGGTIGASERLEPPSGLPAEAGAYVVEISATKSEQSDWQVPVRAYFRRTADSWKFVGLERQPVEGLSQEQP